MRQGSIHLGLEAEARGPASQLPTRGCGRWLSEGSGTLCFLLPEALSSSASQLWAHYQGQEFLQGWCLDEIGDPSVAWGDRGLVHH